MTQHETCFKPATAATAATATAAATATVTINFGSDNHSYNHATSITKPKLVTLVSYITGLLTAVIFFSGFLFRHRLTT